VRDQNGWAPFTGTRHLAPVAGNGSMKTSIVNDLAVAVGISLRWYTIHVRRVKRPLRWIRSTARR
jgi:hypothetical protein